MLLSSVKRIPTINTLKLFVIGCALSLSRPSKYCQLLPLITVIFNNFILYLMLGDLWKLGWSSELKWPDQRLGVERGGGQPKVNYEVKVQKSSSSEIVSYESKFKLEIVVSAWRVLKLWVTVYTNSIYIYMQSLGVITVDLATCDSKHLGRILQQSSANIAF